MNQWVPMRIKVMANQTDKGFTLLEVVVALAILALVMSGLVKSIGDSANNQRAIEARTYAQWVALNRVAETQLAESPTPTGSSNGLIELAARQWQWQQQVDSTDDPAVHRITVTVGREGEASELAQVIGYLFVGSP